MGLANLIEPFFLKSTNKNLYFLSLSNLKMAIFCVKKRSFYEIFSFNQKLSYILYNIDSFTDNLKLQQLKKFLKENRKKLKKKYLKQLNQQQLGE